MISHKHKFIFIHIPKCGGSTVEQALSNGETVFNWGHKHKGNGPNPLPHGNLRQDKLAKTINEFSDYYLFTFVRNPWRRCLSTYMHLKREKDGPYLGRKIKLRGFEEFVDDISEYVLNNHDRGLSGFEHYHTIPQVNFLPHGGSPFFNTQLKANIKLDFTGRVENFDADFSRVVQNLKLPPIAKYKRCNASTYSQSWKKHYTPDLINKVKEIYPEDFTALNYSTNFHEA